MKDGKAKAFVLTFHGVGGTETGSTLRGLSRYFEQHAGASYVVAPRFIDGVEYYCLESDCNAAPDLLEINWSDIRRPPRSAFAELWHVPKLLVGMLHLSEKWHGAPETRQPLLSVYRLLIEFSVWAVPYIVYVMLLMSIAPSSRLLFVVAVAAVTLILALSVWKWSRSLSLFGILWAIGYAGLGLFAMVDSHNLRQVVESASRSYVIRHQSFPFMIYALFAVALLSSAKHLNLEQRLTRFVLAYIPFLGLAIAGAVLWVVAIPFVVNTAGYGEWSSLHARVLQQSHYDLRLAEYSHLVAIFLLGCSALAVAAGYGFRVGTGRDSEHSGQAVRNAIPVLACLIPISLIGVTAVIVYGLVAKPSVATAGVYEVYKVSALRLVPFLPWLLTPMRIVVDIIGDIVYTALPSNDQLAIRNLVLERARAAIKWATTQQPSRIAILSHSLGTVLAACAVPDNCVNVSLVTTGSPITVLHSRFLSFEFPTDPGIQRLNIYRDADYIGGPIATLAPSENIAQARGGHTGYWDDPEVLRNVNRILAIDA